jgi:sensory rhodopsin transducer
MTGKTTWWFPDGDLPEPVPGDHFTSHESLMVLNPNETDATISLVFYWENKPPTAIAHCIIRQHAVSFSLPPQFTVRRLFGGCRGADCRSLPGDHFK